MRLIDADALKGKLQEHHDFFVNAYGGFKNLPPNDKARVDEITSCIAEVVNAPTVETDIEVVAQDAYKQGYTDGWKERFGEPNERPQGEWGKWVVSEIRCPQCLEYYDPDCYSKEELNICPNCGADMRKENDNGKS